MWFVPTILYLSRCSYFFLLRLLQINNYCFVSWPKLPPPSFTCIILHTKAHRSLPPTEITRDPSAVKVTFVTCALWPRWTMCGAHHCMLGELNSLTLPKSSAVTTSPYPEGLSIPLGPTPRCMHALTSVKSPSFGQTPCVDQDRGHVLGNHRAFLTLSMRVSWSPVVKSQYIISPAPSLDIIHLPSSLICTQKGENEKRKIQRQKRKKKKWTC